MLTFLGMEFCMWVVVRNIAVLGMAVLSVALFCDFKTSASLLGFADIADPAAYDTGLAVGCGLIVVVAIFCLSRDTWKASLTFFSERGKRK
jgi:hypothetical protein